MVENTWLLGSTCGAESDFPVCKKVFTDRGLGIILGISVCIIAVFIEAEAGHIEATKWFHLHADIVPIVEV